MKLFKHQSKGVELGSKGSMAFFWDCGTGKTCLMLHLIYYLRLKRITPALVVCPLSIIDAAWIEDNKKFTPDLDIVSLWSKKPAERRKRLAEDHDIYIANFATFKTLFREIQAKGFQVIIVDESSKMKCPTSQITRALLAMAGIATRSKRGTSFKSLGMIPYRYVLSGTPAPNDESEYWAQCKFITGPGNNVFNDNFYAFRGRYFYTIDIGHNRKLFRFRKSMQAEFQNNIAQIADVVAKEDAVDLPEQLYEIREIELGPDERKAYDTMQNDLVLRFANETILASTALVEIMKLRQLSSGFCYGEETHQIGKSKLIELKALLEEIGNHQVIIWANFKFEIRMLLHELDSSDALWSGAKDREATIKDFQNGDVQYLVANPQSAAHGLTFTNCNYAIYFSMNYSYELQKQSEDRIHRIGQNNKCTYFFLIARNTVDKMIYNAVRKKENLSKETLDYLRSFEK